MYTVNLDNLLTDYTAELFELVRDCDHNKLHGVGLESHIAYYIEYVMGVFDMDRLISTISASLSNIFIPSDYLTYVVRKTALSISKIVDSVTDIRIHHLTHRVRLIGYITAIFIPLDVVSRPLREHIGKVTELRNKLKTMSRSYDILEKLYVDECIRIWYE